MALGLATHSGTSRWFLLRLHMQAQRLPRKKVQLVLQKGDVGPISWREESLRKENSRLSNVTISISGSVLQRGDIPTESPTPDTSPE